MNPNAPDWEVELDDFGGRMVRHRHGDVTAVAYVYSNPERAWAECTMCQAELGLVLITAQSRQVTRQAQ
jgi:hypothetical protein